MIPVSLEVESATSKRSGTLPSASEVPPPNGAIASDSAAAAASMSAISCALDGTTTFDGVFPSMTGAEAATKLEGVDAMPLGKRLCSKRPHFAAHVPFREELFGVEETRWIERVLYSRHRRQVLASEDHRHVIALFGPDAVLARKRA